jgi:hypothetical protein
MEPFIKKRIKKLKRAFPDLDDQLERELIPLPGEEIHPKLIKKKVKR